MHTNIHIYSIVYTCVYVKLWVVLQTNSQSIQLLALDETNERRKSMEGWCAKGMFGIYIYNCRTCKRELSCHGSQFALGIARFSHWPWHRPRRISTHVATRTWYHQCAMLSFSHSFFTTCNSTGEIDASVTIINIQTSGYLFFCFMYKCS